MIRMTHGGVLLPATLAALFAAIAAWNLSQGARGGGGRAGAKAPATTTPRRSTAAAGKARAPRPEPDRAPDPGRNAPAPAATGRTHEPKPALQPATPPPVVEPPPPAAFDVDRWVRDWSRRLRHDRAAIGQAANELAVLEPALAFQALYDLRVAMRNHWPLRLIEALRQCLGPRILPILDSGMTSRDLFVQRWANQVLMPYSLQDFTKDWPAYAAWKAQTAGLPLDEVLQIGARGYIERLRAHRREEWESVGVELANSSRFDPLGVEALVEAGIVDVVRDWLDEGVDGRASLAVRLVNHTGPALRERLLSEPNVRSRVERFVAVAPAHEASSALWTLTWPKLDETYARSFVLPLLTSRPEMRPEVIRALRRCGGAWTLDTVRPYLQHEEPRIVRAAAEVLAGLRDRWAVGPLIGIIQSGRTPDAHFGVAKALQTLTGVPYDPAHDGVWWGKWWDEHGREFAESPR